MRHVVHVIHSLAPRHGGPPVVAASLAAAQAAAGHRVQILTYRHDGLDGDGAEPLAASTPGFECVEVLYAEVTRGEGLTGRGAARALESRCGGAEVAHLHNVWEAMLPACAASCRRRGVRHVVLPHGMLHPWSLAQKRLKKRLALALRHRRMLAGASALHLLNEGERKAVEPLGLATPAFVVPNGIWPQDFAAPPPAGRFGELYPQVGGGPYVLFLSRLHFKKGLDYLGDAFRLLAADRPDVRLVVAGFGEPGATDDLLRRAGGAADRVHLVGPLLGEAKWAALHDAAAFCLPSRQEGFPVAALEALAVGTPCVLSRESNFPELAQAGAGVEVRLDAADVADGLRRVLAGDGAAMGEAGRRLVTERYTWPKVVTQLDEAYEGLEVRP